MTPSWELPPLRWARRHGMLVTAWEAVNREVAALVAARPGAVRTPSFTVLPGRDATVVLHRLGTPDNDLGDRVAAELVRPGLVDCFESAFAGVVTSTAADPQTAWDRFYDRTLARLREGPDDGGAVATFRAIYRHALELVTGRSLLDVGSCFGFFCLLAAERGLAVQGTDVDAPTVALAARTAVRRGAPVRFTRADALAPLPRADTVTALHLLEHLAPGDVERALANLRAAARRRVVVAVPLETEPDRTYGHRASFSLPGLRDLGAAADGWTREVHEHHGGWLVLDRR